MLDSMVEGLGPGQVQPIQLYQGTLQRLWCAERERERESTSNYVLTYQRKGEILRATHNSIVLFHVRFKVPLVSVVDEHTAFVESEISLAECLPALVLFTHVAGDQRLQ